MIVIQVRNVQEALLKAIPLLKQSVPRESRVGDAVTYPCPVTTVYERPAERVVFHSWRDANPFFHLYESLWMLAGRHDVKSLTRFVSRMASFSDDGKSLAAAYGRRWRRYRTSMSKDRIPLDVDQLKKIVQSLRKNPDSRRLVLQIWSPEDDLMDPGLDVACNLCCTFQTHADRQTVDMTVFCRSNDVFWGAYGANAVHFSMLHEFISSASGMKMGVYRQVSVNWHAYADLLNKYVNRIAAQPCCTDPCGSQGQPYHTDHISQQLTDCHGEIVRTWGEVRSAEFVEPLPIMNVDYESWLTDCDVLTSYEGRSPGNVVFYDSFFNRVVVPILEAHDIFKESGRPRNSRIDDAIHVLSSCKATDWRRACVEWLERRKR